MARFIYNLVLPIAALLAAPFWLLKTRKRGGLSARLWEKLGRYDAASPSAQEDVIYLHAVSVGEANIALKLIRTWLQREPHRHFLVALGTSTGFDHARQTSPPNCSVIYAPLDFPSAIRNTFQRYRPEQIILIEAEVWPNLIHYANRHNIPVSLVNARLSPRSGRRLKKARALIGSYYESLQLVAAQTEEDLARLQAIGVRQDSLQVTGSIKFDLDTTALPETPFDPNPFLQALGSGPILMALSTHPGEELAFAQAASKQAHTRIVIVPRHMERRDTIRQELEAQGFSVWLRSEGLPGQPPTHSTKRQILLVDSTGELPYWTPEATVAFIGKTLRSEGGQNPCEAIAAEVPLLAGPHFANFEPLATKLRERGGLITIQNEDQMASELTNLLSSEESRSQLTRNALNALSEHRGATSRTLDLLTS